jgi:hypothetical protein
VRTSLKGSAGKGFLPPDVQKHAMAAIEEFVCWHMCGVGTRPTESQVPEVGTATAIRWNERTFLLTADHVVKDVPNQNLEFAFRPTGTLERSPWWQGTAPRPQKYLRARQLEIVHRYRSIKDDLAALEVRRELEDQNLVQFFNILPESKVVRPIGSSLCTIGVPHDSFERLAPSAVAFSVTVHWGNLVRPGARLLRDFNPRKHLLLEFPPAGKGRHPGGFSGAGAWYQAPSAKPLRVWSFIPVLAGLITDFYAGPKILRVTRIERVVAFLRTIAP